MGSPGITAKNFFLMLATLAVTILLIEIGLRVFYVPANRGSGSQSEPDYSYELVTTDGTLLTKPGCLRFVLHPYLQHKNVPDQHNRLFNINALGLRGAEVRREKLPSVFRIIMLGGSGAFGYAAGNDGATIPAILERRLQAISGGQKHVEVLNAGVIAFISNQELAYLETELIDLRPDLVIAYDGYNDFFAAATLTQGCRTPLRHPEWIQFPGFFYEIESLLMAHSDEQQAGVWGGFGNWLKSTFAGTALGGLVRDRTSFGQIRPARNNRPDYQLPKPETLNWDGYKIDSGCVDLIADTYRRNLQQMARFLRGYNVPLLIAVQPERTWKRPSWSEEEAQDARSVLKYLPWYDRSVDTIYPRLAGVGHTVSREFSLPDVDLHGIFSGRKETIFVDPVHVNDHGNEVIAEALLDSVAPLVQSNREDHRER
jgi:lysophospholipase L1-like esterase